MIAEECGATRYIRRMEEPANTGCASKNVEV